ncbi:MAG: hypothetical protein EBR86_10700 [Planctomycetia bacterium]|jgi:hypothetical protein|nr:hypothetical protein [Planctomycetia bacterium]
MAGILRAFGKIGQLLGLGLPVVAVILQLGNAISASRMLAMLLAAVSCFWIGRLVEGYAGHTP